MYLNHFINYIRIYLKYLKFGHAIGYHFSSFYICNFDFLIYNNLKINFLTFYGFYK